MTRKALILAIALLSFCFVTVLSLDVEFIRDDRGWIEVGQNFEWRDLTINLVGGYYRPLLPIQSVILYRLFGENAPVYHAVKNIFYSGLVVVFFLLLEKFVTTRVALLFTTLFAITHTVVLQTLWYSDPVIQEQLLVVLSIYLVLTHSSKWHSLAYIMAGILAIWYKDTAKVVPFIVIAYLFFTKNKNKMLWISTFIIMFFAVFPSLFWEILVNHRFEVTCLPFGVYQAGREPVFFEPYVMAYTMIFQTYFLVILFQFLLVFAFVFLLVKRREEDLLLFLWFSGVYFLFLFMNPASLHRDIFIATVVPLTMLVAKGFEKSIEFRRFKTPAIVIVLVSLLVSSIMLTQRLSIEKSLWKDTTFAEEYAINLPEGALFVYQQYGIDFWFARNHLKVIAIPLKANITCVEAVFRGDYSYLGVWTRNRISVHGGLQHGEYFYVLSYEEKLLDEYAKNIGLEIVDNSTRFHIYRGVWYES